MNSNIRLQREIEERHLANDFPFLKKYYDKTSGVGGGFSSSYRLVGLSEFLEPEFHFLPCIEFSVGSSYLARLNPKVSTSDTVFVGQGTYTAVSGQDGQAMFVGFPPLTSLFELRNLQLNGNIKSLPLIISDEERRNHLPVENGNIRTGFSFRVSAGSGEIFASMETTHPLAESIIDSYLRIIDKRFGDCESLKNLYVPAADGYHINWKQPQAYTEEKIRIQDAMLDNLEQILNFQPGIKFIRR